MRIPVVNVPEEKMDLPKHERSNILLVDDNKHGLQARRSVLEQAGFSVTTSNSAVQALEVFASEKFDLVVTDFRMPGMDGIELIAKLRETNASLPIIMISGFTDTLGLTEQNTGANMVLQKSANEASHLFRAGGRLLQAPAKPKAKSVGSAVRKKKAKAQGA